MRWLITGAQGFLGRYLIAAILDADPAARVVGIGRSPRDDLHFTHQVSFGRAVLPAALRASAVDPRYSYAAVDLAGELGPILREHQPEIVVHLASALRDDPLPALFRTNVEGTAALIEAFARAPRKATLILGSSGGVYGASAEPPPFRETARCEPRDTYSASKLAAEHVARVMCERAGLRLIIARIFNLVGPGQDERHIAAAIARQLAARAPEIVAGGDLSTTRDFIDVRDAARALVLVAEYLGPLSSVNIASGVEQPSGRVVTILSQLAGYNPRARIDSSARPSSVPRHFANISALAELGFRTTYDLRESLSDVLDYYREGATPR